MKTILIIIINLIRFKIFSSAFNLKVSLNNTMINVPASYTFIFKSSLGINSTNYLNITFPKQIQVQNGNRNCLVVIIII